MDGLHLSLSLLGIANTCPFHAFLQCALVPQLIANVVAAVATALEPVKQAALTAAATGAPAVSITNSSFNASAGWLQVSRTMVVLQTGFLPQATSALQASNFGLTSLTALHSTYGTAATYNLSAMGDVPVNVTLICSLAGGCGAAAPSPPSAPAPSPAPSPAGSMALGLGLGFGLGVPLAALGAYLLYRYISERQLALTVRSSWAAYHAHGDGHADVPQHQQYIATGWYSQAHRAGSTYNGGTTAGGSPSRGAVYAESGVDAHQLLVPSHLYNSPGGSLPYPTSGASHPAMRGMNSPLKAYPLHAGPVNPASPPMYNQGLVGSGYTGVPVSAAGHGPAVAQQQAPMPDLGMQVQNAGPSRPGMGAGATNNPMAAPASVMYSNALYVDPQSIGASYPRGMPGAPSQVAMQQAPMNPWQVGAGQSPQHGYY